MGKQSEISKIIDESFLQQQKAEMKREGIILSLTMTSEGVCTIHKLKGDDIEETIFIGNKEELEEQLSYIMFNKKGVNKCQNLEKSQ